MGCALPRRPRVHVSSIAGMQPVTTAIEVSPDSRYGSGDRGHLLAARNCGYKLMQSSPNPDSNHRNRPRNPVAPRIHGSNYAQGNPVVHEQARRSGAILLAAGVLQRLIRLGGKKEPRNPPASAWHCCSPPAQFIGRSATGEVSLSPHAPIRSTLVAARARQALILTLFHLPGPPLRPGSVVACEPRLQCCR
jgi:hypothetical protein